MYCSSCGAAVAPSLIYCNHCGAKLSGTKNNEGRASEISPNTLIGAMVATFIVGMAAIFSGAIGMKRQGFDEPIIYAFLMATFLLMLALEGVFIWLLLRRRKSEKEAGEASRPDERATKELYAPPVRELEEAVPSVIEQTTNRLVELIYRDQKSK
jgi:hypothetical protein